MYIYQLLFVNTNSYLVIDSRQKIPDHIFLILSPLVISCPLTSHDSSDIYIHIRPYQELGIQKRQMYLTNVNDTYHLNRRADRFCNFEQGTILWNFSQLSIGYLLSEDSTTMYCDLESEYSHYDFIRLLMAYYEVSYVQKKSIRCHSATVNFNGKGLCLIGGKGQGKTSFLCGLLGNSDIPTTFISNDKVYLRLNHNYMIASGSVEQVGIRKKTAECFDGLIQTADYSHDDYYLYWPNNLCEYFGNSVETMTKVDCFVFPYIQFWGLPTISRTSYDNKVLQEHLFEFSDLDHMDWLVKELLSQRGIIEDYIFNLQKELVDGMKEIPIVTVQGNPYDRTHIDFFLTHLEKFLSSQ